MRQASTADTDTYGKERGSGSVQFKASAEALALFSVSAPVVVSETSSPQSQEWMLQLEPGSKNLQGLKDLVKSLGLQGDQTAILSLKGQNVKLCLQRSATWREESYLLFLQGQEIQEHPRGHASPEEPLNSAESIMKVLNDHPLGQLDDKSKSELSQAGVLDKRKLEAQEGRKELAQLLMKAEAANEAIRSYNASAENNLQQLLAASERLSSGDDGPQGEEIGKLKLEMSVLSDRLHRAMQDISALTNEVESVSATLSQVEVDEAEVTGQHRPN